MAEEDVTIRVVADENIDETNTPITSHDDPRFKAIKQEMLDKFGYFVDLNDFIRNAGGQLQGSRSSRRSRYPVGGFDTHQHENQGPSKPPPFIKPPPVVQPPPTGFQKATDAAKKFGPALIRLNTGIGRIVTTFARLGAVLNPLALTFVAAGAAIALFTRRVQQYAAKLEQELADLSPTVAVALAQAEMRDILDRRRAGEIAGPAIAKRREALQALREERREFETDAIATWSWIGTGIINLRTGLLRALNTGLDVLVNGTTGSTNKLLMAISPALEKYLKDEGIDPTDLTLDELQTFDLLHQADEAVNLRGFARSGIPPEFDARAVVPQHNNNNPLNLRRFHPGP